MNFFSSFTCIFQQNWLKFGRYVLGYLLWKGIPGFVYFRFHFRVMASLVEGNTSIFFKFLSSRSFVKSRWLWDLINIIFWTYLDSWRYESNRRNLAVKPAKFAGCRLLYTTMKHPRSEYQTLGGCRKKPTHIWKIANTLFEGDVWENICDVSRATPIIHAQKQTSLSEAVFLGISFHITATITFLKISKIWLYSITIKLSENV